MSSAVAHPSIKDQLATNRFSRMPELETPTLTSPSATRDDEAVARLAYAHWEERLKNNTVGSAEDDWYRALEDLGV